MPKMNGIWSDWYICNECATPLRAHQIYNISGSYLICSECLPKKLVSNILEKN